MSVEDTLSTLAARIAAGETIDPASVPAELASQPAVQKLLRFAKVAQSFAGNAGAKPAEPVAPDRIGPWKLLRLLGSGGMGDVWLGERADGTVEHRVAIKRVRGASPAFASRLEAERRILAKLSHPNIARFIDAGVDATGAPWLALDYIDGETLNTWADRTRPSLSERLELFLAICAAVEHAHRHLVVHRDLKPANVLVDAESKPHLLDFGVAKLLDGSGGEVTAAALTPAYAAPEQLRGGEVSTATDVYALGLLLFRLLAGELPSTRREVGIAQVLARLDEEETQQPSVAAHAQSLPYPATTLEGDLDAIVSKAIRALPEARYGSVAELAADVRRHLESRPVSARQPTRAYLFGRWVRRNALAVGLGTAAMLALIAGTGLALWQAERASAAADAKAAEAERADRAAAAARAQAQRAERSAAFAFSVFEQADVMKRDGRGVITIDDAFEDALARIDREFTDDAMVAVDLNDNFGEILASKGRFDEADARVRKALALAEEVYGADSLEVAESALNLAVISSYRGLVLDGRPYGDRALAILASHPEADPLELANARMTQGNLLAQAGESEAAVEQMQQVLEIYEAHLPADDQRWPVARFNYGATLHELGRWADAQVQFDAALTAAAALQGEDAAALLPILDFSMTNLDNLGRHDAAAEAAARMLAIADASFGDDHPMRANARMESGYQLMRAGELARGRARVQEGLDMARRMETPLEIFAWRYLVKGLLANEHWADAIASGPMAAERCKAYGHDASSRCREIAGFVLQARVRADVGQAASVLDEADALLAAIERDGTGGAAPIVAHQARAEALLALGRHADARADFATADTALTARYPATHRDVVANRSRMATVPAVD
jgi:tetratricopeptide (TPR) repeat protein